ncbi:SLC13 family permease [Propionivibrio limicola]|uniref:SLC13 family permease n=1 Tax=Propionivibrio limicola TaxID=167645 RepID=UPI0012926B62|nr:SLC13 family permease [Propionivibrio limicola]
MSHDLLTLVVLAVVAFFFITELVPLAVTAMAGAIAVGVLGIIPIHDIFSGLSNSTVVLFASMFVIGAAMFHTGLAQKIGASVVKVTGTGENSLMIGTMVTAAALSSVTSNTATTACLIPVVAGICGVSGISAKRQMMPMAFAAGLGGIITLVGTPPNTLVLGPGGYKFMDYVKVGSGLVIVCLLVSVAVIPLVWPFSLPKP